MSKPGDLGFLRSLIFCELNDKSAPSLPPDHPQRPWAEWLGLPLRSGPVEVVENPPEFAFSAAELHERGVLPEVVYGCLVQTWWHPGQSDWVARTRSEILACYRREETEKPGWTLELPVVERINAYRLQELTPAELLDACAPYCAATVPDGDRAAMEGWVLLHLESFTRLQDVARCLRPFFANGAGLGWSEDRVSAALQAEQAPAELELSSHVEWPTAVSLLSEARVRRLLG
jgi:hypothetical protein